MSSSQPLPPTPLHILRSHASPLSAIAWSDDDERIYSADISGKVIVTSTRSLRAITAWTAHSDSILGVEEWDEFIITSVYRHGPVTPRRWLKSLFAPKSWTRQQITCLETCRRTSIVGKNRRFSWTSRFTHSHSMLFHGCQCLELLSLFSSQAPRRRTQ